MDSHHHYWLTPHTTANTTHNHHHHVQPQPQPPLQPSKSILRCYTCMMFLCFLSVSEKDFGAMNKGKRQSLPKSLKDIGAANYSWPVKKEAATHTLAVHDRGGKHSGIIYSACLAYVMTKNPFSWSANDCSIAECWPFLLKQWIMFSCNGWSGYYHQWCQYTGESHTLTDGHPQSTCTSNCKPLRSVKYKFLVQYFQSLLVYTYLCWRGMYRLPPAKTQFMDTS